MWNGYSDLLEHDNTQGNRVIMEKQMFLQF